MSNWIYVYVGYVVTAVTVLAYVYSLHRKAAHLKRRVQALGNHVQR